MEAYSGCRVSPRLVEQTLKGVFQIVLQTITQLPMRDMKIGSTTAEFKRLASRLEALAWKSRDTLSNGEAAKRVALLFKSGDINQNRLLNVADELEWAARALRSVISNVRVSRPRSDSPNPQVRFALIFLHWLEVSTGQHHYAEFEHLLHAAFAAANKTAPKWVERLAIEMHSKLKRRKFHRIF
jgi:hypothetical protein